MNLRLLSAVLLILILLPSCALLQLPARTINSIISPLWADGGDTMPTGDYMDTEAMMALKHSIEPAPMPAPASRLATERVHSHHMTDSPQSNSQ